MIDRTVRSPFTRLALALALLTSLVAPTMLGAIDAPPVAVDDPGLLALQTKIKASDGNDDDIFGAAVGIDGDTLIVGAPNDDVVDWDSGSAYIFTKSAGAWVQQQKLVPADAADGDAFGYSVAVSGDTAVIGACYDDTAGSDAGAVYVFTRSGATWTEQAELHADDAMASDRFGSDVAIVGDTIAVSAPADDDMGDQSGSVYFFQGSGATWDQVDKVTATDGSAWTFFGESIDLDADLDLIAGTDDGEAAYVFTHDAGGWAEQDKLVANGGEDGDRFGYSVALSGETAIVGALYDDDMANDAGAAYIFGLTDTGWVQQEKLTADTAGDTDQFGYAVEIEDGLAVVGARLTDDKGAEAGSLFAYTDDDGGWSEPTEIRAADGQAGDIFGTSLALDDGTVIGGASGDDDQGGASGSAYVLETPRYETAEDAVLTVPADRGVLINDTDADGDPLQAELVDGPANGTLDLAADGSFTYTPGSGFSGADSFTYRAFGGGAYSAQATVRLVVTPVNDPPQAADDAYEASEGVTLRVDAPGVLANDTDADGDVLTAELRADAAYGTVSLAADGSFTYVSDDGFVGADSFTYAAVDGGLEESTATVEITVASSAIDLPDGVFRVAGLDRYLTAVEASKRAFPDGAGTVVIATGANWPDALGGAALAGVVDGPLLLAQPTALPASVRTEIVRLGATKAYVLGGTGAVSPAVMTELAGLLGSANVVRLAGQDRYGTAQAVADEVISHLGADYDGNAFVATGGNFPDALAASPLAAANGWPILLAHPVTGALELPSQTDWVYILGGTGAVSEDVEAVLKADLGEERVYRWGGVNRYETAALVAGYGVDRGMRWDGVGIATGENFPDALSGGAMLGRFETVMLLTQSATLHPAASAELSANKDSIATVHIIGGTGAVSAEVEAEVKAALGM